jgi:mRNA interferase YafQ
MTRTLVWEKSFIRAIKKVSKRNPALEEKIYTTLDYLSENPFHSQLDTHKLHGVLQGLWACSVEYDCRIVFTFEKRTSEDCIVLIDIGTHDEVY